MELHVTKRLAIVGLGGWASSMHLPVCRRLQEEGRARYSGLCDLDEAKARAATAGLGGKPYTDLEEMLAAERPDGLVILVKPDATPRLIRGAIELGIPFLSEKPPAPSVAVHRALMEGAKRLTHVIAYNRRFTPYAAKAKEWLAGQPLQSVEAAMCRFRRREADFTDTAVHAIDAALFLAGSPIVEARVEIIRKDAIVNLFLTAWTAGNCRIQLVITPDAAFTEEAYTVRATARSARIEHPLRGTDTGRVRLFEENVLRHDLAARDFGMREDDWPSLSGILAEHQAFLELLEGKRPSPATLEDTLNTQVLREACQGIPADKSRYVREIAF
jgi:predicted dehydrogenase